MGRSCIQIEEVKKPNDTADSDDSTQLKQKEAKKEQQVAVVEKTKRKKVEEEDVVNVDDEEQLRLLKKQAKKAAKEATREAEEQQAKEDTKAARKAMKEAEQASQQADDQQAKEERKTARKAAKEAEEAARQGGEQQAKEARKAAKRAAKEAARRAEELAEEQETNEQMTKEQRKAAKRALKEVPVQAEEHAEEQETDEQKEKEQRKAAKRAVKEAALRAQELEQKAKEEKKAAKQALKQAARQAEEMQTEDRGLKRKKTKNDEAPLLDEQQQLKKAKLSVPVQAAPLEGKAFGEPQEKGGKVEEEEEVDKVEVQVSGSNAKSAELQPWMKFADVKTSGPGGCLPPRAVEFLQNVKGFKRPTAIQSYCWPIACAERDLIGIAKTGSGKTLAFLLPMFPRIMIAKTGFKKGPYMVVLAPTRELAIQIEKEAAALQQCSGVRTVSVYGGAPKGQQIAALSKGADIVVGCPGRMNDFLDNVDKYTGKTILSLENCTALVLDEADRMLDMGFEPQIRKVLGHITSKRQTMLFSATWPKEVRSLAAEFLNDPMHVRVGSGDSFQGNKDIEQRIVVLEAESAEEASVMMRKEELLKILRAHPNEMCIIFCAMKRTASDLANDLWKEKMSVRGIHGDMDQWARDEALRCFRSAEAKILVATDVAARGLDVKGIKIVINYDPAGNQEDHVHRIGRTGRAGEKGVAYTFLGSDDIRQAQEIVQVFKSAGQEVPENLMKVARQRLSNWKTRKSEAWNRNRYGYGKGSKGGKGGSKGGKGKRKW